MASPTSLKAGPPTGDRDILIVGAGLAGLFLALRLAPRKCTVIAPAPPGAVQHIDTRLPVHDTQDRKSTRLNSSH